MLNDEIGEADHSAELFDAESTLSEATVEAGYDSANSVQGSILNLIMGALIVVGAIIIIILRIFCFKVDCIKNCLLKIWRAIFWNTIIRTLLETYLEMALANLIKMYAINDSSWFELLGSSYSIFILFVLSTFIFIVPILLYKKRNQLKTQDFTSKYGALMQELRTN